MNSYCFCSLPNKTWFLIAVTDKLKCIVTADITESISTIFLCYFHVFSLYFFFLPSTGWTEFSLCPLLFLPLEAVCFAQLF